MHHFQSRRKIQKFERLFIRVFAEPSVIHFPRKSSLIDQNIKMSQFANLLDQESTQSRNCPKLRIQDPALSALHGKNFDLTLKPKFFQESVLSVTPCPTLPTCLFERILSQIPSDCVIQENQQPARRVKGGVEGLSRAGRAVLGELSQNVTTRRNNARPGKQQQQASIYSQYQYRLQTFFFWK